MVRTRGFTLIELLVVIAIIGVLSSVVLASLNAARSRANDSKRLSDMREVQKALELYATSNNGQYPNTSNNWRSQCSAYGGHTAANVVPGLVPTYISTFPSDPQMSGNSCCYLYTSNGNDYKLLIAHSCSTANYQSYPSVLDPTRDGGSSAAAVEPGGNAWSWAVYTPGAVTF